MAGGTAAHSEERLRAHYGPPRRETCLVVLMWLVVVVLVVHLVVRVAYGLTLR